MTRGISSNRVNRVLDAHSQLLSVSVDLRRAGTGALEAKMNGRIFLLDGDDLRPMDEQPYDSEDLLQRLLAQHPDLLAGDQIDDSEPPPLALGPARDRRP